MRPSIAILLAGLLVLILGASVIQFFLLARCGRSHSAALIVTESPAPMRSSSDAERRSRAIDTSP